MAPSVLYNPLTSQKSLHPWTTSLALVSNPRTHNAWSQHQTIKLSWWTATQPLHYFGYSELKKTQRNNCAWRTQRCHRGPEETKGQALCKVGMIDLFWRRKYGRSQSMSEGPWASYPPWPSLARKIKITRVYKRECLFLLWQFSFVHCWKAPRQKHEMIYFIFFLWGRIKRTDRK